MNHDRLHLLEKAQVQLATIAAVTAVYFLVWPILRPADPVGAVVFVPFGNYAHLLALGSIACLLACACSVLTVRSRPGGAMLAAMLGVGGICLRSGQIRTLLWQRQKDMASLFGELLVESLILAVVAMLACIVAAVTREMLGRMNKSWTWKNPLSDLADAQRDDVRRANLDKGTWRHPFILIISAMGMIGSATAGRRDPLGVAIKRSLSCMAMATVVAVAMLLLLMRSGDRGQLIFSLVAGFALALLVAHQLFPAQHSIVAWCCPLVTAVFFYAFAWITCRGGSFSVWADVPFYARALPVDWLAAGGGGAMLGYWVSERVHELRHVEKSRDEEG